MPIVRCRKPFFDEIASMLMSASSLDDVPKERIEELARRPETRSILYRFLYDQKHMDLFPDQYKGLEQIAESDLVQHLLLPMELNAVPDEMELLLTIEREEDDPPRKYRSFLFKFRTIPPHWAAKDGWMVGIAGPYWEDEEPRHAPPGVFWGKKLVLKKLL